MHLHYILLITLNQFTDIILFHSSLLNDYYIIIIMIQILNSVEYFTLLPIITITNIRITIQIFNIRATIVITLQLNRLTS